jgi:HD-like signal output (HDOD) protein
LVTKNISLLAKIQELIDSGKIMLPVFNSVAAKIQALANSDDYGAGDVERVILADQVLVAEVLRAANSSFFGGLAEISTVRNAIIRLGLQQVSQLALLASQRAAYDAKDKTVREMMQRLWVHASATALAAGWLARRLGFGKELESESFLGGLMHDVGKLVILKAVDQIKQEGKEPYDLSPHLLEEIIATTHANLGYQFLKRWDIPDIYCEIARDHHLTDFDSSKIPLVTVRLANNAGSKMGLSLEPNPSLILGGLPEAQCLNANDIMLAELEIMMEDSLAAVGNN